MTNSDTAQRPTVQHLLTNEPVFQKQVSVTTKKTSRKLTSVAHNWITAITAHKGRIYVGLRGGLLVTLNEETMEVLSWIETKHRAIWCMDNDGERLLLGCENGRVSMRELEDPSKLK